MALQSINNIEHRSNSNLVGFMPTRKNISYGYIDMSQSVKEKQVPKKDKVLAGIGSTFGALSVLAYCMKRQKIKNPLKVEYTVKEMLSMAAAGNIGGIVMGSIGEKASDIKKKWKEGAFQMVLTAAPMLLVDGTIKLCNKSKNPKINNNFMKIVASTIGVAVGSKAAIKLSNFLRNDKEAKKPERKLKLIDMVANLDDLVAVLVLAKIPFADKIHIERALPVIYSFCGYRSGTGDSRR